jgi:hypothetical protein
MRLQGRDDEIPESVMKLRAMYHNMLSPAPVGGLRLRRPGMGLPRARIILAKCAQTTREAFPAPRRPRWQRWSARRQALGLLPAVTSVRQVHRRDRTCLGLVWQTLVA